MRDGGWTRRDPLLILGIDPGTIRMGFGLIARRAGSVFAVDYGALKADRSQSRGGRLLTLRNGLIRLLDHHRPDALALEQVFVRRNPQSALAVGEARAVVLLTAEERDLPVVEYPAAVAKRSVSGHGGAAKERIQTMVQAELRLPEIPEPHDAADALALALCLLHDPRMDPRIPGDSPLPGRFP